MLHTLPVHQDLEAQLEEACSEKNNLRASQQSLEDRVEHLLDQLKEKKIEMQEREDVLQELRRSTTEERRRKDEVRTRTVGRGFIGSKERRDRLGLYALCKASMIGISI